MTQNDVGHVQNSAKNNKKKLFLDQASNLELGLDPDPQSDDSYQH